MVMRSRDAVKTILTTPPSIRIPGLPFDRQRLYHWAATGLLNELTIANQKMFAIRVKRGHGNAHGLTIIFILQDSPDKRHGYSWGIREID